MIMVQSTFHLVADKKAEALRLMKNMVRLCTKEHGCLSYEYFEGLTDTNQLILLQEWENAECLQEHYKTEHMDDFMNNLAVLLEKPITTRSYFSEEEGSVSRRLNNDSPKSEQTIH